MSDPVSQVLDLYEGLADEGAWRRTARAQVELLAERLLDGHRRRLPGAAVELQSWWPGAAGRSDAELWALPLTLQDALETVARGHGFADWRHVESAGDTAADEVFERMIEDLLAGDVPALLQAMDASPDLVSRRSHYGHHATALHYLAANGVETYRQRVPRSAPALASLLLERGADPLATAELYGGPQSFRALLVTSAHPAEAGVTDELLAVIDGAG